MYSVVANMYSHYVQHIDVHANAQTHKHMSSFSQDYKLVQHTAMDDEHLYSEKDHGRDPAAVRGCC